MTSALGGGGGNPKADKRKGGCVDLPLTSGEEREEVQKSENFADVI